MDGLDPSGGTKLDAAKAAAKAFVDVADLVHNKIGVVWFHYHSGLAHPLSRNAGALKQAIDNLQTRDLGTAIGKGIVEATTELTGPHHNPLAYRSMVLMSDGRENVWRIEQVLQAAADAKAQGIRIVTIGYGADADGQLLSEIASSPSDYHFAPTGEELKQIYEQLARDICPIYSPPPPNTDLTIAKEDHPDPVLAGADSLAYTVTVTNAGPAAAERVAVTDTLPFGLYNVHATSSQGHAHWDGAQVVTASLGTLTSTAYVWVTSDVTCTQKDVLTNTARATTSTPERDYLNNAVTATTGITRVADMLVTKIDSRDPVAPGKTYSYAIAITNAGPSSATSVVVSDTLPSEVDIEGFGASDQGACSRLGRVVTCDWPEIMCGAATWMTITVKADPDGLIPRCGRTTVTNTVQVSALEWDPDSLNNSDSEPTVIADPRICPDLGDAPYSSNHRYPFGEMHAYPGVLAHFPTVYDPPYGLPRGPKHVFSGADSWLGPAVSYEGEADGGWDEDVINNIEPTMDRADQDGNDDSGVLPMLSDCGPGVISYSMVVTTTAITRTRYINAWLDFNRDGDWNDTYVCYWHGNPETVSEWAVRNEASLLGPGVYQRSTPGFVSDSSPSGASPLWMRLTLSDAPSPMVGDGRGPEGGYQFGETEDYLLYEAPPYPPLLTSLPVARLRHSEGVRSKVHGAGASTQSQRLPKPLATAVAMGGYSAGHSAGQPTPAETIAASCHTGNPYYAAVRLSMYRTGNLPAIAAFRDTNATAPRDQRADQLALASKADVGAVYGLAYDWRRHQLYAAAFYHPRMPFGPGGPGAIYRIDLASGAVSELVRLPAGPDPHTDEETWPSPLSGKTSLGDIEIDGGGTALFAMNLYDRRAYRVSLADGAVLSVFDHGAAREPCADNARPFGLGYHSGWLYHAVVNTLELPGLPGALNGYLYRSRPDGSSLAEVAALRLDYDHSPPWQAWSNNWGLYDDYLRQPIIRDIEFAANGDPIVGLGPRTDLQHGSGDLLATQRVGHGMWRVLTDPEHYADGLCSYKDQCVIGALASTPRQDTVVASAVVNPDGWDGAAWFSNASGSQAGPQDGWEWLSSDDIGVGDIESLCPPMQPLYLPIAGRGWCSQKRYVDVVLVLDMSTTMLHKTRDGRPKYEAAIGAAESFVGLLHLPPDRSPLGDQAAIAGFNDHAWLEQGLTGDRDALHRALGLLSSKIREGTRLDLALASAKEVVASPSRRPPNLPVVVLLTDGMPNRVPPGEDGRPETTVLRAADALKASGARVYTIGLGMPGDIDKALLRAIASDPSLYRYAPDAEDLSAIYADLATIVGCQ